MNKIITIIQIVSALVLIVLILLQNKEGGLSGVFGGSDSSNVFRTKRGMEKKLFILTIVFTIFFLALSLASLFTY
ncbi:MAG: Preprotein translocase, SecG subunit [Parcubacteria group bacterium GW2011_GWC2_39_14]|nr:MAG: Preprotein translocase, SecG subunit [Parcubacteria group bacterium GW2011_GWC2_39_14]KKR54751.1 MAG: Preprotein translocase, SecG subunit [Parcubacteria group bacterium GW2011_GWA2_40_23]